MSSRNLSVVIPLFFVIIIDAMGMALVLPVITTLMLGEHSPLFSSHTSILVRNIAFGLTLSLYPLGMFFGAPILGDLSDRFGRKKILLICLLGMAVGYVISGVGMAMTSLAVLQLGRFFCGLMAGSNAIAQATIADITTGKQRTVMMSFIILAIALGVTFGPLIGGSLSNLHLPDSLNYIMPFFAAMILALMNAAWLNKAFHETFHPKHQNWVNVFKGFSMFLHAFQNTKIRTLSVVFFLFMLGWSANFQNLPLYMTKQFGYGPLEMGLFVSFMGVSFSIALGILTRILVKFMTNKQIATLGLALSGMSVSASFFFHQEIAQWICVAPAAMFAALSYNAIVTLFSESADEQHQGLMMGVTGSVFAASWATTGILSAFMNYVNPHFPTAIAAVLMLGSLAILAKSRLA